MIMKSESAFAGQCGIYTSAKHASITTMSTLLPSGRLTTTFAYSTVDAVPSFNVPEIPRDHSLVASSRASSYASGTRRLVLEREEPCFITKRPSFSLEIAHWVNAVREDPARKALVVGYMHTLLSHLNILIRKHPFKILALFTVTLI